MRLFVVESFNEDGNCYQFSRVFSSLEIAEMWVASQVAKPYDGYSYRPDYRVSDAALDNLSDDE